jgi:hypothetical protein
MSYVENAFRSRYGYIGNRPRAYCVFVHESNNPLPQTDDGIQYLSAIMQRARAAKTQAIIVISGRDGLTTDEQTFIDLFKDFKEIKVTLRIYASFGGDEFWGDEPRQFWEVDAHRVSADFEGIITLEDDSETDYSALFAERFRLIHGKRAAQEKAIQVLMSMTGRSHEELMNECRLDAESMAATREYDELIDEVYDEDIDEDIDDEWKRKWKRRRKNGGRDNGESEKGFVTLF